MAGQIVDLGIAGFGLAFGEDQDVASTAADYVPDPERVLKWGYRTFHRAADGVEATDLAARAAEQALERLGVTADTIDLVVLATSEMPEYSYWDSAAALARKLKIERTQTLLLNEGCSSGVTGLYYVASTMAMQPEIDTALFVAVNRVSEFHRNRMNVNNSVYSDGAVATVIKRGHPANRWLATDQFTDPEYSDFLRTDFGGAVEPLPPENWSSRTGPSSFESVHEHFDRDPRKLQRFLIERNERLFEVIDGACERAGISRDDIAHVININDQAAGIAAIAEPLGLPPERTNAPIAPDHGHMGAADQLVSLALQTESGDVRSGDIVALCGISSGMHWCCTLIEV
jgi:3-oxoacyl-[acyl-carrier-protein] synthase III